MSFTSHKLRKVHDLCNEVHDLVEAVEREMTGDSGYKRPYANPSPTTGALRRRSLDLTRALAELRKT